MDFDFMGIIQDGGMIVIILEALAVAAVAFLQLRRRRQTAASSWTTTSQTLKPEEALASDAVPEFVKEQLRNRLQSQQ